MAFALLVQRGFGGRLAIHGLGDIMISDLISYALLTGVFIVTGLRLFFEKPNKLSELPFFRSAPKWDDEDLEPASVDA